MLIRYYDYHPVTKSPKIGSCDNYRPETIFWPCPEVVIISDKYCITLPVTNGGSHCATATNVPVPSLSLSIVFTVLVHAVPSVNLILKKLCSSDYTGYRLVRGAWDWNKSAL